MEHFSRQNRSASIFHVREMAREVASGRKWVVEHKITSKLHPRREKTDGGLEK